MDPSSHHLVIKLVKIPQISECLVCVNCHCPLNYQALPGLALSIKQGKDLCVNYQFFLLKTHSNTDNVSTPRRLGDHSSIQPFSVHESICSYSSNLTALPMFKSCVKPPEEELLWSLFRKWIDSSINSSCTMYHHPHDKD
jgi:hypothetical protein